MVFLAKVSERRFTYLRKIFKGRVNKWQLSEEGILLGKHTAKAKFLRGVEQESMRN